MNNKELTQFCQEFGFTMINPGAPVVPDPGVPLLAVIQDINNPQGMAVLRGAIVSDSTNWHYHDPGSGKLHMSKDVRAVAWKQIQGLSNPKTMRDELIRLGWTPPGAAEVDVPNPGAMAVMLALFEDIYLAVGNIRIVLEGLSKPYGEVLGCTRLVDAEDAVKRINEHITELKRQFAANQQSSRKEKTMKNRLYEDGDTRVLLAEVAATAYSDFGEFVLIVWLRGGPCIYLKKHQVNEFLQAWRAYLRLPTDIQANETT